MHLLADENQHPLVIARLRSAGYNLEAIKETMSGADDIDILLRADIGSLTLITYDRDFGDLIFNYGLPVPAAILYTRLSRADPTSIANRLLTVLAAGVTDGHMTTITKDGERLKPFPPGANHA